MANLATPGRWLRHRVNGTIYGYSDILAKNPAVEEVPEELAFPERFIPDTQRGRKSGLLLVSDADLVAIETPPKKTRHRLAADAAKGLSK